MEQLDLKGFEERMIRNLEGKIKKKTEKLW